MLFVSFQQLLDYPPHKPFYAHMSIRCTNSRTLRAYAEDDAVVPIDTNKLCACLQLFMEAN